jgi:tRNA(adenine34) deaminase
MALVRGGRRAATALHYGVHDAFMRAALEQARLALAAGEVPIGAVVVSGDEVIGRGYNQPITSTDPTAHAEIVALRAAAHAVGNYRLTGARVYVTLEPCLMCVGAMVHARVREVIYGAVEPKTGAIVSTIRAHEAPGLNHRVVPIAGVLESDCRELMQQFFKERRSRAAAVEE